MNSLGDWIIAISYFFFWLMFLWIFVSCFMDIFRRDDLGGGMKAVWVLFMLILPFLGCLVYILTRPKVTATDVQNLVRAEAAGQAASQVSTADELAKLADLKEKGVVNDAQYEALKAKLLA